MDLVALPADAAARIRFLHQATCGVSVEDAEAIFALKNNWRNRWLNQQFAMPKSFNHFQTALRFRNNIENFSDEDYLGGTEYYHPGGANILTVMSVWKSMIEAPDQLRQRVTAALLEIFVINQQAASIGAGNNTAYSSAYVDRIETHAFGNFRELLESVSTSPIMGAFLTYAGNEKAEYDEEGNEIRVPDENYAREIMQLFTIGLHELKLDGTLKLNENGDPVETYSQNDVVNLARVFTGWDYPRKGSQQEYGVQDMVFFPQRHSPESKQFLGHVIPPNTDGVTSLKQALDVLFNHPNTAPFICKQLIQRLVTSNPTPNYVAAVASKFEDNGAGVRGDMQAVIRQILTHGEARSRAQTLKADLSGGKLREPMLRLTAIARLYRARARSADFYPLGKHPASAQALAQAPLLSPSVFNFFRPGFAPTGSGIRENDYVAPEFQIAKGMAIPAGISFTVFAAGSLLNYLQCNLADFYELADQPGALCAMLSLLLTADGIEAVDLDRMADAISNITQINNQNTYRRWRTIAVIRLITSHPAFLIQN